MRPIRETAAANLGEVSIRPGGDEERRPVVVGRGETDLNRRVSMGDNHALVGVLRDGGEVPTGCESAYRRGWVIGPSHDDDR